MAGQSDPLYVPKVMKTHIPLTDDPAQEEDLLQRYQERIEKLSQQDREVARDMGSPRHVTNRRERTREGPEPACANTFGLGMAHAERKD